MASVSGEINGETGEKSVCLTGLVENGMIWASLFAEIKTEIRQMNRKNRFLISRVYFG
jgi:hypothetical protein